MTTNPTPVERGHSTDALDVPHAPVYVSMFDRFMSGWGPATDLRNFHVVLCADWAEGDRVARNADKRPEMRHVRISTNRPYRNHDVLYSWSDAGGWK